jgi:hypothetical protein
MVIGEQFAWGHLRKTGGNATLKLFQILPELIFMADPNHREEKHRPFAEREVNVMGKLLVCNMRRLPSVVLSWCHHINYWGDKGYSIPMKSPHEMSEITTPDAWLSKMTDQGRFEIGWWLRRENLADDFIEFASWFTDVSDDKKAEIRAVDRINSPADYDREVSHWFSDEHVARLYENNPLWASAEQAAYGNRRPPDHPGVVTPVDTAS